MRPLLLTLQAVGPYAGRQTVDFRAVLDAGLFGIYGATGSGKSTIFSALTFALFGETARNEQLAPSLRSDHADPGVLTTVELVFAIGNRTFRIVRQPEQSRPAKRGSGETKEPHKAQLFDVTGLDIDTLSDANPGKSLAEAKVKTVDEAVRKLLGYGAAQFRQIVLLPQGRFEAFLSADTRQRLEILRDLFDVSLYRRLTEKLKSDADDAEKEVSAARNTSMALLTSQSLTSIEALAEAIADAGHRHRDQTEAAVRAKTEWDAALQRYQSAVQTDAKFIEHRAAQTLLAQLEAERPEIEAAQTRLRLARLVHALADAAAARENAHRDHADARARQNSAAERLQLAATQAEKAKAARVALEQQTAAIEKSRATLHTYRDHAERLAASHGLRIAAGTARDTAKRRADDVAKAKVTLSSLTDRKERTLKARDAAQAAELQRARLTAAISELTRLHEAAARHADASHKAATATETVQRATAAAEAAAAALRIAERTYAEAEAALLQDHAVHLAAHLNPGDPCPVCGSPEHPSPARDRPGGSRLGDAFAQAKAGREAAAQRATQAATQVQIAKESLADRTAALAAMTAPERPAVALAADLQSLTAQRDALGKPVDESALQATLSQLDHDIAAANAALDRAQRDANDADQAAAAAQRSFEDAIAAIPHDLREATTLQSAIATLTATIADFEKATQAAIGREREAAEKRAAAERESETIAGEVDRRAVHLERVQHDFAARLEKDGLTAAVYEERKADVAAIAGLEARIRRYEDQQTAASDRLQRATAAISALDRPDLNSLTAERDAAEQAYEKIRTAVTETAARLDTLRKLQADLAAEAERVDQLEKATAPLRELAEAFAGRTYQRIDLETFAISTLFDRVLDAANLRLSPMTRGRYSLVRESEGRGNARRGLGIAVDDTFTGRQRATSTLSGGETFIAALALALGLSDVVESAHGSVRLDAIFIDEGFGSLDSENDGGTLYTVLQTLQDLVGPTRAVGLISHVPLVQQAIPNGFFVTKTPAGSRIEIRA